MTVPEKRQVHLISWFYGMISTVMLLSSSAVNGQSFSIEPVFGYTRLDMDAVNADISNKVLKLSARTGYDIPIPDPLQGNYFWGIQVNYHMENNYFLNVGTTYFREIAELTKGSLPNIAPFYFHTRREIQLLEINFGLKYYFNYNSWRKINFYVSGGTGYALGWSKYNFDYNDGTNSINNSGDFSSGSIIAYLGSGITLRFTPRFSLNPELGYHFANLGQMSGQYRISQIFPKDPTAQLEGIYTDFITEENYNYSGFFARIGLQFFFNVLD